MGESSRPVITLTTDFGEGSFCVGQMKGAILACLRNVQLVDITHSVPPQNILFGAFVLRNVFNSFPTGTVHIVVVDPGVGTDRLILCATHGGHFFIGPNNGVLSFLLDCKGGTQVRCIENLAFCAAEISDTFHGRDIMAPTAVRLAKDPGEFVSVGRYLEEVSKTNELAHFVRLDSLRIEPLENGVCGEVIFVDSFGNLITNIRRKDLPPVVDSQDFYLELVGKETRGLCRTYGDEPSGPVVWLFGSNGWLEIAVVNGSASLAMLQV